MDPDHITAELPDSERERLKVVGNVQQRFRPNVANAFAAVVFGVAASGGSVALFIFTVRSIVRAGGDLPFFAEKGMAWLSVALCILLSFVLLGIGIFCFWMARLIVRRQIYFCDEGIWYSDGPKVRAFPWSEVIVIEETVISEGLPLAPTAAKLLIKTKSSAFLIRRRDGEEFRFSVHDTAKVDQLIALLQQQAEARHLYWRTVEEQH